jgi:poly(3-hydroxybutyrate) depolymerase
MSNGAMMAYRLAALQPGRIAAVGAVSGTMDATLVPRGAVPVMHVHGTADRLVPSAGGRGDRTVMIGTRNSVADTIAAWIGPIVPIHARAAHPCRTPATMACTRSNTATAPAPIHAMWS